MAGRIEVYTHSDKSVPNKGGTMVRVVSQTDFAARTEIFINFSKKVAKMAFGSSAETWSDVAAAFPELELERVALEKEIKESISVDQIVIMHL